MRPLYALHKNRDGKILGAGAFEDDYSLGTWVRKLDLRDGDSLAFGETTTRADSDDAEFDEVDAGPAFLQAPPTAEAAEEQPAF